MGYMATLQVSPPILTNFIWIRTNTITLINFRTIWLFTIFYWQHWHISKVIFTFIITTKRLKIKPKKIFWNIDESRALELQLSVSFKWKSKKEKRKMDIKKKLRNVEMQSLGHGEFRIISALSPCERSEWGAHCRLL